MSRKRHIDDSLIQILRDPKKRRAWVIYQLGLKGMNLSDIAREHGVVRGTVYHAFNQPYPRMERAIADALGMLVTDLWPERYKDGVSIQRPQGRPNKSLTTGQHRPGQPVRKPRGQRTPS
jgi:Ner family transcriptional regulator